MKKSAILFAAMLGLVSMNVQAQQTATATLNVRLFPIQSIMVNAASKNVDLDYTTKADYTNGKSKEVSNHLSVYSTGQFTVEVQSTTDKLEMVGEPKENNAIDIADITVQATQGTSADELNTYANVKYNGPVQLSTDKQTLMTGSTGINKDFNVTYKATGDADKYLSKYYSTNSPTVYTTNVQYSITVN